MPPEDDRYDRRPPLDGIDDETVLAKQEERAGPRPSARLAQLLHEQEVASRPSGLELGEAAYRSVRAFEHDTAVLTQRVVTELDELNKSWEPQYDRIPGLIDSDLTHVYGPDADGTGEARFYKHGWVWLDSGQARADPRTGKFFASNYTTGPARFTVAQIGVQLKPRLASCKLSIRPYLRWTGFDLLTHRVHDPNIPEQRWAWALGSVGISVDSWNPDGGGHFHDAEHWVNVWDRSEPNPSGSHDRDGVGVPSTGLGLEVFAVGARYYTIWITCRVGVSADPGFAISTYATSSISCDLPFFVVEEIPL